MDSNEAPAAQGYKQKLQQYEAAFTVAIHQQYPLSDVARQQLQQLQQSLNLSKEVINSVEAQVTLGYERKLQQYEDVFVKAIQRQYLLDEDSRKFLENFQRVLNLNEKQTIQGHKQKLQQYEAAFTVAIYQQYPLSAAVRQLLQDLQQTLKLRNEITQSIETQVTQGYEGKLQQYEDALNKAIQRQHPLSDDDREFLDFLRRGLNLSQKITDSIQELENFRRVTGLREEVTDSIETKVIETYNSNPSQASSAPPRGKPREKVRRLWLESNYRDCYRKCDWSRVRLQSMAAS